MKSLSEQVDDRSISELQNNNQQLRTSLEHSAYVQSTDLAPFTSGTIVNVKPLQGESKYDYLNNENENIWIVVCSIHGRKYIAEYDLSDEYYRDEFIKLCDFHDVSIDEPINLIGKSNPIQVSSNSGTFSLFYNNYHSYPGTIMRSRFFKTSVSGFQMQPRYFVLSLLIGGISSMGLMYTFHGICFLQ